MEENKELRIGTTVYIIEPKIRSYKIKQGIVHAVANIESQSYMIQFKDAAQTISLYYRSELYLSKDEAHENRVKIINNEIQTNLRCIDTYNDFIASLQASTEALKRLL